MALTSIIPTPGADPKLDWRWRVSVSMLLGGLTLAVTAHIALACGLLQAMYPGFALASDVTAQARQLTTLQMSQIDNQILVTRTRQCDAMKANPPNESAKQFAERRLQDLMEQWAELAINHQPYRLPDCSEL